ncbi:MAG: family 16 glycosylhydrolase [Bacteroidota bacterium]
MKKIFSLSILTLTLAILSLGCGDEKDCCAMPAALFITDLLQIEGNSSTAVEVSVSLVAAVDEEITVHFSTESYEATAGEDFAETHGTLTFPPGETTKKLQVQILGDTLREADERFFVKLSDPVNAELSEASAFVTLRNDDTFFEIPDEGYATPETYDGYDLQWSDEFKGKNVNTSDWTYDLGDGCPNNCGWGNNELESYTNRLENVFLTQGKLVIEARKESYGGKQYTSTRMKTQGLKEFQYGRIDIRAKLPVGKGVWPALWMLGSDITSVGWPACGEIDIMEYLGHDPDLTYGTGHWGTSSHHYVGDSIHSVGKNYNEAFHVFSILWEQDKLTWLMDDQPFFELTPAVTGVGEWAFNHPFFFIFNVAVGGNWPGNPDGTTTFPQRMIVDYVRVFKKQ